MNRETYIVTHLKGYEKCPKRDKIEYFITNLLPLFNGTLIEVKKEKTNEHYFKCPKLKVRFYPISNTARNFKTQKTIYKAVDELLWQLDLL